MQDDVRQLLAEIKAIAEAKKNEIHELTEKETAQIREYTESQIMQFRDEELARLEGQLRTESDCIVGRAELEIRDQLIQAQNEALNEVFNLATEQIAELEGTEKYQEVLKRLIQEALEKIDCEDVRLQISKSEQMFLESLKGDFPESISVELCDGPKGTVLVQTNDGSQSLDNSIYTRLEMAQEVMRRELVEILFEAETNGEESK